MALINKSTITLLFLFSLFLLSFASHNLRIDVDGRRLFQHHGGEEPWWEEGEEEAENPYHFGRSSFETWFRSKEGFVKVLPRFSRRSWRLFHGIENHRFAVMETAPRTFVMPHHTDADFVFVVLRGKGVVVFVTEEAKESFHIEKGHVARVPAGTTYYMTNTDDNEPLRVAKIFVPVNIPGRFEKFFPAASEYQQSYFRGFSSEVLTASFNISEELLGRLLRGQQTEQRVIRTISAEEIKELSRHATSPKRKHQGRRWSPFKLHGQDPIYSNDFGQFYEAHPERFKQLQDLGISVTCANMTQRTVFVPQYNSKATFVVFVEKGCGRFEMACPHIESGLWQRRTQWGQEGQEPQREEMTGEIHRVVSHVCKGEVFIIPAGHPVAVITQDQNFTAIGFGINARNNTRMFLAGHDNMLSKLDTAARRLTFGVGRDVAEKVFTSQNYSYFVPTFKHERPQQRKEEKPFFQSIFNAAGY